MFCVIIITFKSRLSVAAALIDGAAAAAAAVRFMQAPPQFCV